MITVRARLGRKTVLISPDSGGETAAELAAALGFAGLRIDGHAVPDACPLVVSGLREGSELTGDAAGLVVERPPSAGAAHWRAVVVTGPDSGGDALLGPGRHVVGRSHAADLRIDDGRLEPHHVAISVPVDDDRPTAADAPGPNHGDPAEPPPGGEPAIVQLAGAVGMRVDRTGGVAVLRVGASRIEIRPATADAGSGADATDAADGDAEAAAPTGAGSAAAVTIASGSPWHREHHRPLRAPLPPLAPEIEVTDGPATTRPAAVPAAIVPALLGACGMAVIAVVLHQPLILLFGVSAVLVAMGTWAAQHVSRMRRGRADRAAGIRRLEAFAAAVVEQAAADSHWLRATTPDVVTAVARIDTGAPELWERRPAHGDAWVIVLGRGERPWRARLDRDLPSERDEIADMVATLTHLPDVPITTGLTAGCVLGLAGRGAAGVARAAIVQLAASSGPADWELLVVADRPDDWAWATWLPHATTVIRAADATTPDSLGHGDGERRLVVVVDAAGALASRTSPLRRLLASDRQPAAVVVADETAELPGFCTAVLATGADDGGSARWFPHPSAAELPTPLHTAGVTTDRALRAAARLAHRRDPEVDNDGGGGTPRDVDLLAVLGDAVASDASIAGGWERRGADPPPAATIGAAADGTIEIDLCRDGPHTLIGGTTGAGKSELLRTLLVSLAVASPPELLSFVLVDYKGGAAFDACATLPHVAGMVTDLDEHLAARALRSLDAEIRRREHLLRDVGAADLPAYRVLTGGRDPLARLVVVVDEFATLATELPAFLSSLVSVAQRGRSLGVHLVLATQRPGAAINDDIRGNTNLRIALRVQDASEAIDVVGDRAPAAFGRATPGRAMLRLGSDERVVFQVATTCGPTPAMRATGLRVVVGDRAEPGGEGDDSPTQLETLVGRITRAAAGRRRARPVWPPVLPDAVSAADLAELADVPPAGVGSLQPEPSIGIADDPDRQRRVPLRWHHRDGHLIVAGALGSGTTATAVAVVRGLAARQRPERLHVYVLDGRGDERLGALRALPHCAGVIGLAETERLERLLRVLHRRTRGAPADAPAAVLVIDGMPAVRSAVDALGGDLHERFDEIIADGPAAGLTVVATTDQPVLPLALTARAPQRWIMRLADPTSATLLDLAAADALGPGAPPGRLIALPERLEAQVVAPDAVAAWAVREGAGPAPIGVLPSDLDPSTLPPGSAHTGRTTLPVGLGATVLEPVHIDLADGDHVLVLGTSRSGRSSALARLAIGWHQAHPAATVTVVTPRRSPLTAIAADRGWHATTAFDPEEMAGPGPGASRRLVVIDDAELIDHPALPALCGAPGVTVLAASRPDALRGMYGHWTSAVRRSRTGLVLGRTAEIDGDQLGVVLPRRWPVPQAPGRGWLVVEGACVGVVQVAAAPP